MRRRPLGLSGRAQFLPALLVAGLVVLVCLAGPAHADRERARILVERARAQLAKGDPLAAVASYLKAAEVDPSYPVPHAELAGVYYREFRNLEGALAEYGAALEQAPQEAGYYRERGRVYEEAGQPARAAEDYRRYLEFRPPDAPAVYYRLARVEFRLGRNAQAMEAIQRALHAEPGNPEFLLLQAKVHRQLGQHRRAIEVLDRVEQAAAANSQVARQAVALRQDSARVLRNRSIRRLLLYGGPVGALIVLFLAVPSLRGGIPRLPRVEMDPTSPETVGRYLLQTFPVLTGLPRGMMWAVRIDPRRMVLRAWTVADDPTPFAEQPLDPEELGAWLERRGSGPFLFGPSAREEGFRSAFPGLVDRLGPQGMAIGVPLVCEGRFLGLVLLGPRRPGARLNIHRQFERVSTRLEELAAQAARALDHLRAIEVKFTDPVTGLRNRGYFEVQAEKQVSGCRTAGIPMALVLARLDQYEALSRQYGERVGEPLRRAVTEALKEAVDRHEDITLCHLGDGVFGLLCPGYGRPEAREISWKLKAALESLKVPSTYPRPTGCLAFAVYPDHADSGASLRRAVEEAFRAAVYLQGNRIVQAGEGEAPAGDVPPPPQQVPGRGTRVAESSKGGLFRPRSSSSPSPLLTSQPESRGPSVSPFGRPVREGKSPPVGSFSRASPGGSPSPPAQAPGREPQPSSAGEASAEPPLPLGLPEEPPEPPPPEPPAEARQGPTDEELEALGIDPVTRFCYPETFQELMAEELARASEEGSPCSLLYIHPDDLAGIEDPPAVRRFIADLSSLVSTFLRDGVDVPGRTEGDDFAIFLPDTPLEVAANLAEQIRFTVSHLTLGGAGASLSVGVASFPERAGTAEELLERARQAAREGASRGGDQVQIYGSG